MVDFGSPPQPVRLININKAARKKWNRIKVLMVGIVAGSPGYGDRPL
jgi:hypothetical protein